ncbi:MAG: glutathione S-transferase family protein [Pseudomonadota bacterium]
MILHHYDFSNYSEKIRLVFGLKRAAWDSVEIPAYAPKPDYTPLTAGYRRTPALQIGADVYCDTRLIVEELERRLEGPSVYGHLGADSGSALCTPWVHWAETSLMRPLALYITGVHARRFPDAFHADRAKLHLKAPPSVEQVENSARRYRMQVEAQWPVLEQALHAGRPFLLGDEVTIADLAAYEAPWFLRTISGDTQAPLGFPAIAAWSARVAELGHGEVRSIDPADALARARAATPAQLPDATADPDGPSIGTQVKVGPFDQQSPATGELLRADARVISIARESPETGLIHVHFPRLGYRLSAA